MEVRSRTSANGQPPPPPQPPQHRPLQPPVQLSPTNPICRCRVMYLGSSVPHITKDGLQGIQEPLRELYPADQAPNLNSANVGIDSWLSIWSNGILIENVDETGREVKRFFKIEALHYCAAVKYVDPMSHQPQHNMYNNNNNNNNMMPNVNLANLPRFLPLDSPHSRQSNPNPPVFASIIRRTTGIKVLECHAFICKREAAANALVRCCFHAYADTMYAKQLCLDANSSSTLDINNNNIHKSAIDMNNSSHQQQQQQQQQANKNHLESTLAQRKSKSIANLTQEDNYNKPDEQREVSLLSRRKSTNEQNFLDNHDYLDRAAPGSYSNTNGDLKKQSKFSKSMHHLDQANYHANMVYNQLNNHQKPTGLNQSTSSSCINLPNGKRPKGQQQQQQMQQVPPTIPFHTPYSARIPSYPPEAMLGDSNNTTSHGGTLRSIKSMAANSIASTLLRSKKHSKATSMAQLNQDKVLSFHQPAMMNAATLARPMMMPPVPAMFLPNLPPAAHHMMNGSQTMKPSSGRALMPILAPNMNFEAMTPKEMKKLLKKSAKYGLDPTRYDETGLPLLPIKPPFLHLPPPTLPPNCHLPQPLPQSRSGTMVSQSAYSDIYSDLSHNATRLAAHQMSTMGLANDPNSQLKPLLVKPNPEFLKSKAGKKWLKQQKEFKKLLPPHLEGLPIIFGPPPMNAMEPAGLPPMNGLPAMPPSGAAVPTNAPPFMHHPGPPHPGLPVLDSSGYYNQHPFYGAQNGGCGRASAASTLLRYSPHSQIMQDSAANNGAGYPMGSMYNSNDCWPKNPHQAMLRNGGPNPNNSMLRDYSDDSSSMAAMELSHNEYGLDPRARNFLMEGNGIRQQKQRNHMVEQSVISLGDEHDFDDEEEREDEETDCEPMDMRNGGLHNDTYTVSSHHHEQHGVQSSRQGTTLMQTAEKHVTSRNHNDTTNGQADNDVYSQPTSSDRSIQQNDDQSSYSSGIYRRGHMNERAFSYSIRQEHKSNGTTANSSDAEYSARNEIHSEHHTNQPDNHNHNHHQHHLDNQESHMAKQQQLQGNKQYLQQAQQATGGAGGNIYQANKRDKNVEYYRDNNDTRSIPVNELTARLENQLNMRSFANSRIKSHI